MQTLVLFAVLLTSYLTSAGLLAQPGFGSFRQAGRKSDVNEDIDAFINLIPRAKIEGIVNNWIAKDEEVQEDLVYVHSDNFQEHVRKLESSSEFQAVSDFLTKLN